MLRLVPYQLYLFRIHALSGLGAFLIFATGGICIHPMAQVSTILAQVLTTIFGLVLLGTHLFTWHRYRFDAGAGFVALVTEITERGGLPDGVGQVELGLGAVRTRFGDDSSGLEGMMEARLRPRLARHSYIYTVVSLFKLVKMIVGNWRPSRYRVWDWTQVRLVQNAVLSRAFLHPEEEPWRANIRGTALYERDGAPVHLEADILCLVDWAVFLSGLMLTGVTTMFVGTGIAGSLTILALLWLVYGIRLGFFWPLRVTTLVLHFNDLTRGASIDTRAEEAEVEAQLDAVAAMRRSPLGP